MSRVQQAIIRSEEEIGKLKEFIKKAHDLKARVELSLLREGQVICVTGQVQHSTPYILMTTGGEGGKSGAVPVLLEEIITYNVCE